MKNNTILRKIAGISAAVIVAAGMISAPMNNWSVSATTTTYSIKIDKTEAGHEYAAYQIFKGDLSGTTLSNIEWGSGVSDTAKSALGNASEKAASLTSGDDTANEAAAAAFAKVLKETSGYLGTASATDNTDDNGVYELSGLEAGYYLIVDNTNVSGDDDSITKYILNISKDTTISPKTDKPTLEKKIWDNVNSQQPTIEVSAPQGSDWVDVADHEIGDTVYFYTKTSVPDMTYYDTYKYIIRDSMSDGLTYEGVDKVVYVNQGGTATEVDSSKYSVKAEDDGSTTDFTEDFYVNFDNLKTAITADGGHIYVYYKATLNENALVSNSANSTQGNTNEAYLTYSNDPNDTTGAKTGDTPKDVVYDWTFTFNGEKVDGDGVALAGAGFTLYDGDTPINLVEITDISKLHVNGITELDSNTKYYMVAESGETQFETVEGKNKFMILGLDDQKSYTLKETKTPDGYNTCTPITVNLASTFDTAGSTLESLQNGTGANSTTITNNLGSTLPSTGGIGTKIFYIGGGTLAGVAGVFLIARKRMNRK